LIKKRRLQDTDASQHGIDSLMQNRKLVNYPPGSLTSSEQNIQIEKELLIIVFATQKFHYYIYERQININTDHKPLISILNKKISDFFHSFTKNKNQTVKIK